MHSPPPRPMSVRKAVLHGLEREDCFVDLAKASETLGLDEASVRSFQSNGLLRNFFTQGYSQSYVEGLRVFAGTHKVTVTIAWLYYLEYGYQSAPDEASRIAIIRDCRDIRSLGRLVGVPEAAEALGVRYELAWKCARSGKLPRARIGQEYFLARSTIREQARILRGLDSAAAISYLKITQAELDRHDRRGIVSSTLDIRGLRRYTKADLDDYNHWLASREMLSIKELSDELDMCPQTLALYVNKGLIKARRLKPAATWRVEPDEIARIPRELEDFVLAAPKFEWLEPFLKSVDLDPCYLTFGQLRRRYIHNIHRWRRQGLLPIYYQRFFVASENPLSLKTKSPCPFFPEVYFKHLKNFAGPKPITREILTAFRDGCAEQRRLLGCRKR